MALAAIDVVEESVPDLSGMDRSAAKVSGFLKAIGHPGRLLILCHLVEGEKSVSELESLLGLRQAAVSQQLSRLRRDGLVRPRRQGKTIFYRIGDTRAQHVIELLNDLFCDEPA